MTKIGIKTMESGADFMLSEGIESVESICNFFGMYPGEMTIFLLFASIVCFVIELLVVCPIVYLKHGETLREDWEDFKCIMDVSSAVGFVRGLYGKVSRFPSTFLILKLFYLERVGKNDVGAKGSIKKKPILAGRARKGKT